MTPNAFLTDDAWQQIVPLLIKGLRKIVEVRAYTLGIDAATAHRLLIGLTFDGFKTHVKNLSELIMMAEQNILALVENRDSSAINQAFDKFVAKEGKRRAAVCLDQIRRAHITPIIDQWVLVLVGLSMLVTCSESNTWENSFVAVNMHPWHRVNFDDWLVKIAPAVKAAEKFEAEVINDFEMLPTAWRNQPLSYRQKWMSLIDEEPTPSWDIAVIEKLRKAGMSLSLVSQIFKIWTTEKRIALKKAGTASVSPTPQVSTPAPTVRPDKDRSKMVYHIFNAKIPGASNLQRFEHAITVRNRSLGPKKGIAVSAHLDVEISDTNKQMLSLTPADINMHQVLQQSTCRTGKRRRVARRCLNALGGVSGLSTFLNDEQRMKEMRLNMKFAASYEAVKHAERDIKERKVKEARDKHYWAAMAKMGLNKDSTVYKKHVVRTKLTIAQMKAVGHVDCGETLSGRAAQVRSDLIDLLPKYTGPDTDDDEPDVVDEDGSDGGLPEFETQQQHANIAIDIPIEDMVIGDCVEVWWKGDKQWYEGRITGVNLDVKQFEVEYFDDDQVLTHNDSEYKVRMSV